MAKSAGQSSRRARRRCRQTSPSVSRPGSAMSTPRTRPTESLRRMPRSSAGFIAAHYGTYNRSTVMFLRELHVEHLRAIRSATVRFDASTTLIGENDSGKGSLLRALELMLGSDSTPSAGPHRFPSPARRRQPGSHASHRADVRGTRARRVEQPVACASGAAPVRLAAAAAPRDRAGHRRPGHERRKSDPSPRGPRRDRRNRPAHHRRARARHHAADPRHWRHAHRPQLRGNTSDDPARTWTRRGDCS